MSALAGIWRLDGSPGSADDCARMLAVQAVYSNTSPATWAEPDVAIGRRLFRTLPEDVYDRGVVELENGGRMVADVRLDNRPELERELGIEPQRAKQLADSSLLGLAWTRWGEPCFEHLVGDYAVAVWDERRRRLVLARDANGRRPLHYHRSRALAAFASMPAGLHVLEEAPAVPDEARLVDFLALRPERGSFFEGVERVEPGGLVVIDQSGCTARRHYRPRITPCRLSGAGEYAEALREKLDQAVAAQLRGADGAVAAQLSAGWDSAAVAATAARLLEPGGGRVTAFTAAPRSGSECVVPEGREADESAGAAEVAALYANMDHVIIRGRGRSPLDDLDRDIAFCGRPMLNPCNHVWLNDINQAARTAGLRIVLTGDFGNIGLTDDGVAALPELAEDGEWRSWLILARAATRAGVVTWPGAVAASLEPRMPPRLTNFLRRSLGRRAHATRQSQSALRPELWDADAPQVRKGLISRVEREEKAVTRMDLSLFGKGALARFGVDMRDPLTDRRLLEFCLAVPMDQLSAGGRLRGLARMALEDRLPASTFEPRPRGYQAADWHEGLTADRGTVVRDLDRIAAIPAAARLLDIERLRGIAERWPTEGWDRREVIDSYRMTLLRGLAVGRFISHTLRANV